MGHFKNSLAAKTVGLEDCALREPAVLASDLPKSRLVPTCTLNSTRAQHRNTRNLKKRHRTWRNLGGLGAPNPISRGQRLARRMAGGAARGKTLEKEPIWASFIP